MSAAVQSIEDHGYILDLGLSDLQGFLSFKDTKEFTPNSISKDGQSPVSAHRPVEATADPSSPISVGPQASTSRSDS